MSPRISTMTVVFIAAILALHLDVANATARLRQSNTIRSNEQSKPLSQSETTTTTAAHPEPSSFVTTAAARLESTFVSWKLSAAKEVQHETIADDMSGSTPSGMLAASLWTLYKLTGSDVWRVRALEATRPLIAHVDDLSLGQALSTLTYPALRYAYENELDTDAKNVFLESALEAADTISRLYVRITGVFKVRLTADISAEARAAGAASISPLAVFTATEGAAATIGLMTWAASLPGGKPAWRDMAISHARRMASDSLRPDGSIRSTLVYKATSAAASPRELNPSAAHATSHVAPSSDITSSLSSLVNLLIGSSQAQSNSASSALDAWISSVSGVESSPELRQALATLAFTEAAQSATDAADVDLLTAAAEASAAPLVAAAADESSSAFSANPAAAASTALALAELSTMSSMSPSQRTYLASASRNIIASLAVSHSADESASDAASSLIGSAGRWLSGLLSSSDSADEEEDAVATPLEELRLIHSQSDSSRTASPLAAAIILTDLMALQAVATLSAAAVEQ